MTLNELCNDVVEVADELVELDEIRDYSATGPAIVDIYRLRQLVKLEALLNNYFQGDEHRTKRPSGLPV